MMNQENTAIRPLPGNLSVIGARVNNLRNIDVDIPHGTLTVITGLSGSGKSSLAFDTIFAEGQRRYIETFSSYARNMLGNMERPDVDKISGLSPVIAIEQKTINRNPRSTHRGSPQFCFRRTDGKVFSGKNCQADSRPLRRQESLYARPPGT